MRLLPRGSAVPAVDLTQPVLQYLPGARYQVTDYAPSVTSLSIATTNAPWVIAGDWAHLVVARRQGMALEPIPMLFDTTSGRPTGQRGVFGWTFPGHRPACVSNN